MHPSDDPEAFAEGSMTGPTMAPVARPTRRPARPQFSCGPTVKRPGWSVDVLKAAAMGRWHRSTPARRKLEEAIALTRRLAGVPDDYSVLLMPGSNTGAFESALWNLLGPRPIEVLAFDRFGFDWLEDITGQLGLTPIRSRIAEYGECPPLADVEPGHDVVCVWNGTTAGVCLPDADWIPDAHEGLVLCDATSAIFGVPLPWQKLDAVSFSWQKMLGGEGAHGMLVLSPRALARLAVAPPDRPIPKIMRLPGSRGGPAATPGDVHNGAVINTFSLLALEDYLDALRWAEGLGAAGSQDAERRPDSPDASGLMARVNANYAVVERFLQSSEILEFAVGRAPIRSRTSITIRPRIAAFAAASESARRAFVGDVAAMLEAESVAFDIESYRHAPAGFRLWAGATVEAADLAAVLPWIEWAVCQLEGELLE